MSAYQPEQPSTSRLTPAQWNGAWQRVTARDDGSPLRHSPQIVEQTPWGAVIWGLPDADSATTEAVAGEVFIAAPGTDPSVPHNAAKRRTLRHTKVFIPALHPLLGDAALLSLPGISAATIALVPVLYLASLLSGSSLLVLGIPLIVAAYFAGAAAPAALDMLDEKRPNREYRTTRNPDANLLTALDALHQIEATTPGSPALREAAWALADTGNTVDMEAIQTSIEITDLTAGLPTDQAHQVQRVLPELLLNALTAAPEHRGTVQSNLNDLRTSARDLAAAREELDAQIDAPQHAIALTDDAYTALDEETRQEVLDEEAQHVVHHLNQEASILRAVRDEMHHRDSGTTKPPPEEDL